VYDEVGRLIQILIEAAGTDVGEARVGARVDRVGVIEADEADGEEGAEGGDEELGEEGQEDAALAQDVPHLFSREDEQPAHEAPPRVRSTRMSVL
jgi:hypothetical protein